MLILNNMLYIKEYQVNNPKAIIILTHGLAEHLGRYEHFSNHLVSDNYYVIAYDLIGHGRSGGKRGYINHYEDYLNDLHQIVSKVKEDYPKIPIVLFGHSMGGLLVHLYQIKYQNVDGLISSAAVTQTPKTVKKYKFLWFKPFKNLSMPVLKLVNGTNKSDFNYHEQSLDPYILKKVKINLVGEVFIKGMRYLHKNLSLINLPVLYLHGIDDESVSFKATDEIFNNVRSLDKTLKKIVNAKHDLLNDVSQDIVIKDIKYWLNKRF